MGSKVTTAAARTEADVEKGGDRRLLFYSAAGEASLRRCCGSADLLGPAFVYGEWWVMVRCDAAAAMDAAAIEAQGPYAAPACAWTGCSPADMAAIRAVLAYTTLPAHVDTMDRFT